MLGEEERSIISINMKKYPKQIQYPVTDLKMELLAKLLTNLNCKLFSQKSTRCVTFSEFASDYHKSNAFYEKQKSYITVFWNGGS